jgi:hypothetical protein
MVDHWVRRRDGVSARDKPCGSTTHPLLARDGVREVLWGGEHTLARDVWTYPDAEPVAWEG